MFHLCFDLCMFPNVDVDAKLDAFFLLRERMS